MSGIEVKIRDAVPSDAIGIAIVQAYTWLTTYAGLMPDGVLRARVEKVPSQAAYYEGQIPLGERYVVAEAGNAIVGFAVCEASRNEDYPTDGEIQAIYVLKGFQGKGIGRDLFARCIEKLRRAGFDHMILNCLDSNPSIGFYEKMGGYIAGERTDMLRGGHVIREKILRFDIG